MSGKKGGTGGRLMSAVIGAAAAFAARKVLNVGWKKVAGKEPPEHPEDPQVAFGEALIWGVLLGAGVSTARMLAIRATSRHPSDAADTASGPPA
jgi:hypothetical protein